LLPWQIPKPTIAAINGHAVGLGVTLALQYDLRIAAEDAKLGLVFTRRGVIPENRACWLLPRLVGTAVACDLLMSGRIITGTEAAELGVVNEAVPADRVVERALEIAASIAENAAPVAVAVTKELIWSGLGIHESDESERREIELFYKLGNSPDAAEGVTAFLEKRKPKWSMSPTADYPESGS
jgi:enoyl-CoA hydratase/carnithine racemase